MAVAGSRDRVRLVATKLLPPPTPPGAVDRGGALIPVAAEQTTSAVVVVAPAGSGKTVLLSQFARDLAGPPDGVRVAWVSLDERDDDPRAFWAYLRAAVAQVAAAPGAPGKGGTDGPDGDWDRDCDGDDDAGDVVGLLAAAPGPVVLVLDDYHAITDERIHRAVGRLVGLLPAQAQVVVASRTVPPLPLARWRLAGRLLELTAADLAFTQADAALLLRDGLGVAVDDDQVAALVERTQGWAAGLRVAGLSLQRVADRARFIETFSGNHHDLISYLSSEVLDRLPDRLRDFLIATAVLRMLTADSCDAVLAGAGSAAVLEQLGKAGLFVVAADDDWSTYGVHPLFRDVLLARLRTQDPEAETALHLRAADWFAHVGDMGEAIEHLLAAGEPERARSLLVEHWVPLSNLGRHRSVWRWLAALPQTELERDPQLCVMAAWTRLNQREYAEAEAWLARIASPAPPVAARAPGPVVTGLASEATSIRSHARRHLGDVEGALRAAQDAVRLAPAGDHLRQAMAHAALGVALYWAGHPAEAVPQLHQAARHGRDGAEESSVVLALMYEAACLTRGPGNAAGPATGRTTETEAQQDTTPAERARALAGEALRLAAASPQFHVPAMAYLALARLQHAAGRPREALQALADADRFAVLGHEPLQCISINALRARAWHLLGQTDDARAQLRAAQRTLAEQPDPGIAADDVYAAANELRFAPRNPDGAGFPLQPLTARELTLLGLLDSDLTRQQLAAQLYVSLATIKTHLHSIARKLGVSDRRAIVTRARQLSLLPDRTG